MRAPEPLPDGLMIRLRANKSELMGLLAADTDSDSIGDWYEERAAIMEYDAGLSREDAEREAWNRVIYGPDRLH